MFTIYVYVLNAIIKKTGEFLSLGAMVCAVCGAAVALANFGLFEKRPHLCSYAIFAGQQ